MPRGTPFKSEVVALPTPGFAAAAKNYSIGKSKRNASPSAKVEGDKWQEAAWDFYDTVGEYRYGVDWVGNLLSKAMLYPTKDGERTTDPKAVEAMAALFGGPEGQGEMLRQLGIQFTVAGEAWIIGLVDDSDTDDWFVIAASEISRTPEGQISFHNGEKKVTTSVAMSMSIRIWRPHPRRPKKATSPSRAVLPILSEIDRLTQHVAAQIDSRLTSSGLLLLPSQFSFPSAPTRSAALTGDPAVETVTAGDASVATSAQAFVDLLVSVAETAIDDQSDASARVPIVAQVDGEYIDKVQFIKFWTDLDAQAIELRKEAIRRLALGLDMPPEVLEGTADTNHWAAWQIDESAIKSHSEPLLAVITSSLAVGYLRPALLGMGVSEEEVDSYGIGADTSELRLRPNRSKEAFELWREGQVSGETLRRENGFGPEDAMGEDERKMWLLMKLAQGQTTPEIVARGLKMLGVDIGSLAAEGASDQPDAHEARPRPSIADHPVEGPPNDGVVPDDVVAASEVMVFRALERAGNRLKNRIGGRTPDNTAAADLYRVLPVLTDPEIESLLEDAWTCTSRFSNGTNPELLNAALDGYTRTLLRMRKAPDNEDLRRHLSLSTLV